MKESKFTKEALLRSTRFEPIERDILKIVLVQGQTYTTAEAEQKIEEFKGGIH
ncbi:hypothetical protein FC83_GL000913 [Agrilactobacillus composti DSM 18527 = JCM 14202]|uniref:Uncharacterized protein n=1 Tax=Agrilactobacillus composti DSM 18527 = JCM 14202 TaxID=1423734 RepID=X0PT36_9LACO|nr:hypothetical protein [Agrilactobacillus composti]KRM35610.1 hypothetical protein FC83_GL000913 [Agrilactobacillus composti DSM 18527 = JCM 14202]GAF41127.1 hypothetical protein JCM14202_3051 [Agrilactobacillus composti DSM 18527 = JCM 14202]